MLHYTQLWSSWSLLSVKKHDCIDGFDGGKASDFALCYLIFFSLLQHIHFYFRILVPLCNSFQNSVWYLDSGYNISTKIILCV